MEYYKAENGTIEWLEDSKIVLITWQGFSKNETHRQLAEKALTLAVNKRCYKWLANACNMGMLDLKDQEWWAKVMLPKMAQMGIRYNVVVMPKSVLATMSVKQTIMNIGNLKLVTQNFGDLAEAKRWLASQ